MQFIREGDAIHVTVSDGSFGAEVRPSHLEGHESGEKLLSHEDQRANY